MLQSLNVPSDGERISRSLKSAPSRSRVLGEKPQNDFASARFEGNVDFRFATPTRVCATQVRGKARGYESSPVAISHRFYRDIIARAYY